MLKQRENIEQQAIQRFEEVARKHHYDVITGQGSNNRIPVDGNTYFQFGDLRVETKTHHVVIEVESAGGVTNLVKYWYCIEKRPESMKKPVILLHVFRQSSRSDYGSHLVLWDILWGKMKSALGGKIEATRYTYREIKDIEAAVKEFEKHLEQL